MAGAWQLAVIHLSGGGGVFPGSVYVLERIHNLFRLLIAASASLGTWAPSVRRDLYGMLRLGMQKPL